MVESDFLGRWYISEMEMWDKDYIDAEVRGYILFNEDGSGEFQFGYVHGFMNCKYTIKDNDEDIVEFTWEGNDECDFASGRGYCKINNSIIIGKIFINNSETSKFKAIKGSVQ